VKLNLGCGNIVSPGWVNVDLCNPRADIIADVRQASFSDVETVNMMHLLEHIPRADVVPLLRRIREWCRPGATMYVEVPDMAAICQMPISDVWEQYVYGSQEHAGEFHCSGFDLPRLRSMLERAGWHVYGERTFLSEASWRPGMPCIGVSAIKPGRPDKEA